MKKILTLVVFPAFALTANAQNNLKVKGKFETTEQVKMVYLNYMTPEGFLMDSSELKNGEFLFNKKIDEPTLAILSIRFEPSETQKNPRADRMELFLEKGTMNINAKDSLKSAIVSGSKAHNELVKLNKVQKKFDDDLENLRTEYRKISGEKNNDSRLPDIGAKMRDVSKNKHENLYDYLQVNYKSPIALYVLDKYSGPDIALEKIEPIFNKLSESLRNSPSGQAYKEKIEAARNTSVGAYAMNFTQNDTLGNPVSLSDFKGKYVLIDFWASWCGPCRAENPNVVKAFNEYKDKGFTIVGISLDQPGKHAAWMEAIHKDGLTWTQLSDLKGWKNEVSKMYNIQAIPQNFLLDPKGKIIAKNIRGEELHEILAEQIK